MQFSLPIIFVEESRIADLKVPSLTSHLKIFLHAPRNIQRVSKRMTRFQIIISNNENLLQLQNKLQTIK